MSTVEDRLRDAFSAAAELVEESPDLFARVERSIAEQVQRQRFRRRVLSTALLSMAAVAAFVLAVSDIKDGRLVMRWGLLELLTATLLVAIAALLGPFIKRFGKSYAGDVFRANPRTGKSYIMLTDIAYYLIFIAFIMFTTTFQRFDNWDESVGAEQLKHEVARIGGILLIIGLLHSANIVMLPMMGRLLSLNRQLDDDGPSAPARMHDRLPTNTASAGLSSGAWVLRIEPADPGDSPQGPVSQ
jgi:hypothetical protein